MARKPLIFFHNLAPSETKFIYYHNLNKHEFYDFLLPFHGHLSCNKKWAKLPAFIQLDQFEKRYQKNFLNRNVGHPALSVRMAMGALIIKEELVFSDWACVELIRVELSGFRPFLIIVKITYAEMANQI